MILLLTTPIYFSLLGVDRYGIWILIQSLVGMGGMFTMGMSEATLKFVAKYRSLNDRHQVVATIRGTWAINLIMASLIGLLFFFVAPWLTQTLFDVPKEYQDLLEKTLKLTSFGFLLFFTNTIFEASLQGFERYDLNSLINIGITISMHTCLVASVFMNQDIFTMFLLLLSFQAISALAKAIILKQHLLPEMTLIPTLRLANYREIFNFSLFSWLNSFIGRLQNNGDIIIIGSLLGTEALGYYHIATRILSQIYSLAVKSFGYLFPLTSRLFEQKRIPELRNLFNKSTFIITLLSSALIVPIAVLSYSILELWLGTNAAVNITLLLQILAFRYAVIPLSIVNIFFLYGNGKVKLYTATQTFSSLLILASVYYFTRKYGLIGVGYGQCSILILAVLNRIIAERILFGTYSVLPHVTAISITIIPLLLFYQYYPDTSKDLWQLIISAGFLCASSIVITCILSKLSELVLNTRRLPPHITPIVSDLR
jgi:O-antigen/teichoic acid export membrane protein